MFDDDNKWMVVVNFDFNMFYFLVYVFKKGVKFGLVGGFFFTWF